MAVDLQPVAPIIQVATNLDSGEIFIDGHSAGTVKNGQFQLPSLDAGKHTLKLVGTDSEAVIPFDLADEKSPEVASRPLVKNVTAAVVTMEARRLVSFPAMAILRACWSMARNSERRRTALSTSLI